MGSLHSLLRKNRVPVDIPAVDHCPQSEFDQFTGWLVKMARPPACILVNAQNVADDTIVAFNAGDSPTWNILDSPCVTPPFETMWFEFSFRAFPEEKVEKHRYAVQTIREDHSGGHTMMCAVWMEHQVCPGFCCMSYLRLDDTGAIDADTAEFNAYRKVARQDLTEDSWQRAQAFMENRWRWVTGCALQALSRMNCKNAKLRPLNEGKFIPHSPNPIVPASVWHEIVITSVPKIRSTGRNIFTEDEREIRAHWIRGHYADYRKGAGLFGNPKLKGLLDTGAPQRQ